MTARKTEFWWASIHGADPEPVEKTEREGRPCVYTLGCADPFYLDEPATPVRFIAVDWASYSGSEARYAWVDDKTRTMPARPMPRPSFPGETKFDAPRPPQRAGIKSKPFNWAGHGWRGPR